MLEYDTQDCLNESGWSEGDVTRKPEQWPSKWCLL